MEKIHTKICINCTHVWVTQIDSNIRLCRVKGWEEAGFNNRSTCLTARVESRPSHSHPSSVAVTLLGNRCNQIKASSYWPWVDPDPMTAFLLKKKKKRNWTEAVTGRTPRGHSMPYVFRVSSIRKPQTTCGQVRLKMPQSASHIGFRRRCEEHAKHLTIFYADYVRPVYVV